MVGHSLVTGDDGKDKEEREVMWMTSRVTLALGKEGVDRLAAFSMSYLKVVSAKEEEMESARHFLYDGGVCVGRYLTYDGNLPLRTIGALGFDAGGCKPKRFATHRKAKA